MEEAKEKDRKKQLRKETKKRDKKESPWNEHVSPVPVCGKMLDE
jgi:hypothetical protein